MKEKRKRVLLIFCLFILSIFVFPKIYTLCIGENNSNNYLNATIYDNSQYNLGGDGLELTSDGVDINGWNYTDSKYLHINVAVPNDNKKYVVKVKTAKELYFVTNKLDVPTGFSDVSFKKNEDILVNTNSTYSVNDYSGTAFYTVSPGITTATIQLELKYDYILWNKQKNAVLNTSGEKALTVELLEVEDDSNVSLGSLNVNTATSGVNEALSSFLYTYVNGVKSTTALSMVYNKDNPEVIKILTYLYKQNQDNTNFYFKKLKIVINLPYYVKDGKKYYLDIKKDSLSFSNVIGGKANYDIDDSKKSFGIITVNLVDVYINGGGDFLIYEINPPKDLDFTSDSIFTFTNGSCEFYAVTGESEARLAKGDLSSISYSSSYEEKVSIKSGNFSVPYNNTSDTLVSLLGGFYLDNLGTGDSEKKHVDMLFDSSDTGYIKVTTVRMPTDRTQKSLNVKYRLVDDNNTLVCKNSNGEYVSDNDICADYKFNTTIENPYYSTDSSVSWNNINIKFYRGLLPIDEQKYYLKEVIYDIDTIKAGTSLYVDEGLGDPYGTGNYYGFINYHDTKDVKVYSKISITGDNVKTLTKEATTSLTDYSSTAYSVSNISINDDISASVLAGNSLTLKGQVNSINYPYGTVPWMNNIVIGLLLPNGISVNEETVNLKTEINNNIKPSKVVAQDLYNGYKMWKIYVPKDITIGYYNEALYSGLNGDCIKFEMQLNTEYYMNQQSIDLKSSLFTASAQNENGVTSVNNAAGSYDWARQTDTYDLNGDGSTSDIIGGVSPSDTTSFEIIPQKALLDISDSINVNKGDEGDSGHLFSSDDVVNYNLTLNCTHGGSVEDFNYYIPIPKTTSSTDNYLLTTLDDIYNLNLQNEVSVVGDDLYDIYYSTKEGLNINNAKNDDVVWLTKNEVTDFTKVTMIKLLQKNPTIESDSFTTISLKLKYGGNDFNESAGKKITFHSAGNYTYLLNGRETSGLFATPGVTLDINYIVNLPDITLTAAPNRSPSINGNVISYQTDGTSLPRFIKSQNLSITNVSTYNVTLNTKNYMNSNLDMEGIYANEMFAVTASLNNGVEQDILTSANDSSINIGLSNSNTVPILKYTIYNANNILDNSTTRYIVITFKSDNGVTIKQKININREFAKASNLVASIVSGDRYQLFDDTTTSVSISKNSSITTQFVLDYIPDMYSDKYIVFDSKLPVGTTLTLYDYVNNNNPSYWYYVVEKETNKIKLTDFIKMGYQSVNYKYLTGTSKYKENYLLNINFSNAKSNDIKQNSIHLEMMGNKVDDIKSINLSYSLNDNRAFKINMPSTVKIGTDFNIDMNMTASLGVETNYFGKKMSYVISTKDLPYDTYILYNNEKYYMNTSNKFIIPLGDVLDGEKNITLSFNSNIVSLKDTYNLDVDLMVNDKSSSFNPLMGNVVASKTITLNYEVKKAPSFRITKMSERVISQKSLKNENTIHIDYIDNGSSSIYVELQKKMGNSYQKVTDKLNRIAGVTNHNTGVFNINVADGGEDITFKLANTMEKGIYRFVFTIKNNNNETYYEVPYSFVITD